MIQTRWESAKEILTVTAIKYVIGLTSQIMLFPLVGIHVPIRTNIELSVYFTVVSIACGYWIRRWENARLRKKYLETQHDKHL